MACHLAGPRIYVLFPSPASFSLDSEFLTASHTQVSQYQVWSLSGPLCASAHPAPWCLDVGASLAPFFPIPIWPARLHRRTSDLWACIPATTFPSSLLVPVQSHHTPAGWVTSCAACLWVAGRQASWCIHPMAPARDWNAENIHCVSKWLSVLTFYWNVFTLMSGEITIIRTSVAPGHWSLSPPTRGLRSPPLSLFPTWACLPGHHSSRSSVMLPFYYFRNPFSK